MDEQHYRAIVASLDASQASLEAGMESLRSEIASLFAEPERFPADYVKRENRDSR